MVGRTISHYRVLGQIGAGGMGVVYAAEDLTLGRRVALKVLPPELAGDETRLQRFEQEARTVAALNHPNIVTIYSIERADGAPFLTMELVDGKTLDTRIPAGGMALRDVLDLSIPLADAVAAAHEMGIVHRDLKPANVMVCDKGRIKVLDFGLAKLRDEGTPGDTMTRAFAVPITGEGRIVGTIAYMSPEQAEGRPVDARSDVFSLGVMLYEMATGELPFQGETAVSILSSILKDTPRLVCEVNPAVPRELARIVRKCLAKDRERRYQSAKDLRNELEELKQDSDSGELASVGSLSPGNVPAPSRSTKRRVLIASVGLFLVATGGIGAWLWWQSRATRTIAPPATHRQVTFSGDVRVASLSPDGRTIAYAAADANGQVRVLVRDVDGEQSLTIWQGRGLRTVKWMPDGASVVIAGLPALTDGGAKDVWQVWSIPRLGGTPKRISGLDGAEHVAVARDGRRIAGANSNEQGFRVVPAEGGESRAVAIAGVQWVFGIEWGPASDRLSLRVRGVDGASGTHAMTLAPDGGNPRTVGGSANATFSCWSPTSDYLYVARPSNGLSELVRLADAAPAPPSAEVLATGLPDVSSCSVSDDGDRLLHIRSLNYANLWRLDLVPPGVPPTAVTHGTSSYASPHISSDGRWIVTAVNAEHGLEIVRLPVAGGDPRTLARGNDGVFSSDMRRLAFVSDRGGAWRVSVADADGQDPKELPASDTINPNVRWLPDGRLAWQRPDARDYVIRDLASGLTETLVKDPSVGWVFNPHFSPAGDRVAVYWNRQGARGLWVLTWPGRAERFLGVALWPVGWSADGRFIYAHPRSGTPRIIRVDAATGREHPVGTFPVGSLESTSACDLTPDRLAAVCSLKETKGDAWLLEHFDPRNRAARR